MWHSLRVRMGLALVLVGVAAIGTVAYFANRGTVVVFNQYVSSDFERDRQRIATLLQQGAMDEDPQQMQGQVETLGQTFDVRIFVIDPSGLAVAASDPQWVGEAVPAQVVSFGAAGPVHAIPLSDTLAYTSAPVSLIVSPAPEGEALPPDVLVRAPITNTAFSAAAPPFIESINRSFFFAAGAALAVAAVMSWGLSRSIFRPVQALTEAARRLERGDLTQRVAVEAQDEIGQLAHAFNAMADGLSRAEQLRRQMVSDVAHELRTPLTNIRGHLEAVKDGLLKPDPAVIDSLYEEALLLNRLVDDLQELALAEAGQLRLARQPVALGELIASAVSAARPMATEKGLTLRAQVPPDLPLVMVDPARIGQALRNLLTNALAHTPSGGAVVVSAEAGPEQLRMSVEDTGEGIALEHLPFVFERFYRAEAARGRETGGAGLGLAIVKHWVEAHGGSVSVQSEGIAGRGARFTVTLPLDEGG